MTANFYTYFHTRDDSGVVFYVGKGRGSRCHETRSRNPHWKNIAGKHGHTVHMAMTNLTEVEAFEHERFLIVCFKQLGISLCNMTDGGEGTSNPSPSTRAKLSASQKGRVRSAEVRECISAKLKGKVVGEETRSRLSIALKGRVLSPEWIAKMVAAKTGMKHGEETRAKMAAAQAKRWAGIAPSKRGASEETKTKISASKKGMNLGRRCSDETRAKISAANKGKKRTDATKAKLSASARVRGLTLGNLPGSVRSSQGGGAGQGAFYDPAN